MDFALYLPLVAPVVVGILVGWSRLFPKPDEAIRSINRFALYVAFPLLIFRGICFSDSAPSDALGFIAVQTVATVVLLGIGIVAASFSAWVRRNAAPLLLGSMLGNIAYIGIPFNEQTLGPESLGLAAMSASLHVILTFIIVLPVALRFGSGERVPLKETLKRIATQPLVWAPIVALLARLIPRDATEAAFAPLRPLASTASPVALFLLGMYLFEHRQTLLKPGMVTGLVAVVKLGVMPGLNLAVGLALVSLAGDRVLHDLEFSVMVFQTGMPTAISAFALAYEFDLEPEAVAKAVVFTTVLGAVTLPLWVGVML